MKCGEITSHRLSLSTNCVSKSRAILATTILGDAVAVGSALAPGKRAVTVMECVPAEEVVMLPKSPFLSFIEESSSSEPAVETALLPETVVLAVLATALIEA